MPEDVRKARRPGRPRGGEPALTRQAILAAALAIVDEHGIAALSMRRLATELAVDPMSIYHHLPNKAAIVSGLVTAVFSEMAPVDADGAWPDRVRAWALAYRDLVLAHPNLVLQIVTDSAAATVAAIQISEPLYAALDAAGLTPGAVVSAAGVVVDFVNGHSLAAAGGEVARPPDRDEMVERLTAAGPGRVPTMRRIHAAAPPRPSGFAAGLEIIIGGIRAIAA